jgi:hypothetical protein
MVMAFIVPFELFLLSYAVLGPLHYLTEINWLNNNNFYLKRKRDVWVLIVLAILISAPAIASLVSLFFQPENQSLFVYILKLIKGQFGTILFVILVIAIAFVYRPSLVRVLVLVFTAGVLMYFFRDTKMYYILFTILLPTIIHVYLFTLLFVAYGAIKTRSVLVKIEVIALAIVPLLIALIPVSTNTYILSVETLTILKESKLGDINNSVGQILGDANKDMNEFILSGTGIRIQIFIAFAYTYHYLNWFSKVKLIGWLNDTSLKNQVSLVIIWTFSLTLYYYDYRLGLTALTFLSMLHVILEFPLNIVSIRGVIGFVSNKLRLQSR